jgi:hypothetical protein
MELCILGILMIGVADELLNSRVVAHIGAYLRRIDLVVVASKWLIGQPL